MSSPVPTLAQSTQAPGPSATGAGAHGSVPVDLRPLTTSELIDRGFTLYRAHFAGFLLLALLAQAAPLLSQILIMAARLSPSQPELFENPLRFSLKMLLILGLTLGAMVIVFGFKVILTSYFADAYLGKVPSVTDSMRRFVGRMSASLWTCLLNMALIGASLLFPFFVITAAYLYFLLYLPVHLGQLLLFGGITGLMLIASVAPVLIIFMRLMLTVPALALEGLSGWKSVWRSNNLVRFDPGLGILYWGEMRLSFLLLPLFVIEMLTLSLTSLPLIFFEISETLRHGGLGQMTAPPDAIVVLSQIFSYIAGALIWPLYSIVTAFFYYDVRIRREGLDLDLILQRLEAAK